MMLLDLIVRRLMLDADAAGRDAFTITLMRRSSRNIGFGATERRQRKCRAACSIDAGLFRRLPVELMTG